MLIGINAHINLDLGIAAAEISRGKNIEDLKGDFNKINQILSDLVNEVEDNLAAIWPTLEWILKFTRKVDNFLVDFSMELARDGAWRFAQRIAALPHEQWPNQIQIRDQKVSKTARLITHPGWIASFILGIIRLGERGTVVQKIEKLKKSPTLPSKA